ncbi:MAG: hypothetical protein GTO67_16825 [Gammaproteobacteria bacterium]|nr:hypothetical protein [Gammaproteobacteria bacterium]NIN40195.1 hypothetical protein [Gammaproteobacteria bacterium]NIO24117.1 hypothetical protein [Gammaproteobacteria bacterium]NIO65605.1 hypothetical protein [Gammaproteobacteria bacterium]NIP46606.1 ABC transporter substrate-binding protein [Gammaproteobacteria bacterium]
MQQSLQHPAFEAVRAPRGVGSSPGRSSSAPRVAAAALVWLVASLTFVASAAAGESGPAPGSTSGARALLVVQDTVARVLAAVSRHGQQGRAEPAKALAAVEKIVMPSVDLERVSRLVLGKHWQSASAAQRARFKREFGSQLMRTYAIGVIDYLMFSEMVGSQVTYLTPIVNEDSGVAIVPTKVGNSAIQARVDYRLHRRDGTWKVYDVMVDGVSTVRTYRSSFIAEMSRHGIDRLIERIAAKNREFGPT